MSVDLPFLKMSVVCIVLPGSVGCPLLTRLLVLFERRLAAFIRSIEPEDSSIASPLCQSCLRFLQKHKIQGSYIKDMAVRSLADHNETSNQSETLEQGPKSLFFHGVHGVPLLLGIRCSRYYRHYICLQRFHFAGFDKCCLRFFRPVTQIRVSGKHNRYVSVTLLTTLKKQESLTVTE